MFTLSECRRAVALALRTVEVSDPRAAERLRVYAFYLGYVDYEGGAPCVRVFFDEWYNMLQRWETRDNVWSGRVVDLCWECFHDLFVTLLDDAGVAGEELRDLVFECLDVADEALGEVQDYERTEGSPRDPARGAEGLEI